MLRFKKHEYPSGLRLICAPSDSQTVTVLVLVGAGSKHEAPKEAGLSHFLEHMFFKGTKKRPNAKNVAEFLDAVGGEYNAFTHKEFTGFYAKVAKQHTAKAFDFISDMLLNAKFAAAEISREKGVIMEEMNMYQDTPMRYVGDIFETLLYGSQPAGKLIIGNKKTVSQMKRSQFIDYRKSFYLANNMVVAVTGGISESRSKTLAEQYFAKKLKAGEVRSIKKTLEKQDKPAVKLVYKKTDQSHLSLGVRTYDLFHKDRVVLHVLSALLGSNMSSRLFIAVRERRGLAYYVRSNIEQYTDTGYLTVTAGTDNTKVMEAIKTIVREFKRLKREAVPAKELHKAKEFLKGQLMMGLEETSETAVWIAVQELLRKKVPAISTMFSEIDSVTSGDIKRVAKDIFTNKKINLAMISPHKSTEAFRKLLAL